MQRLEQFVSEQRMAYAEQKSPAIPRDSVGRKHGTRYSFRYSGRTVSQRDEAKLLKNLEARVGIEPTHKGFAALSARFCSSFRRLASEDMSPYKLI